MSKVGGVKEFRATKKEEVTGQLRKPTLLYMMSLFITVPDGSSAFLESMILAVKGGNALDTWGREGGEGHWLKTGCEGGLPSTGDVWKREDIGPLQGEERRWSRLTETLTVFSIRRQKGTW